MKSKLLSLFRRKRKASAKLPEFLPILEELARAWAAISDDDLARCARSLTALEADDKKLGVLHSAEVRRTLALAHVMVGRCREARLYADNKAQDETEAKYYKEQAERFDALEDCAREFFWTQVKDDIGGEAWSKHHNLGIREGWMVVAVKPKMRMPDFSAAFGLPPS